MKTVGVIGVGLIGGSIAKCLKERNSVYRVIGFDLDEQTLETAVLEGVLDVAVQRVGKELAPCDIVFICTPTDTIEYARQIAPHIKPEAVITDVGSTKKLIMDRADALGLRNFIGGHPMAGSEKSGYAASKPYLFENACYALCRGNNTGEAALQMLWDVVQCLGAMPILMDAALHDRVVACVSHAPHVVAAAMVNTARTMDDGSGAMVTMAAGGFKDITRIASSSPQLWDSIIKENRREILLAIDCFKKELSAFERELCRDDCNTAPLFYDSKTYRDSFSNRVCQSYGKNFIMVDVEDKPGMIATVSTLLSVNNINIKNIGVINNREYEDGIMQIVFDTPESRDKSEQLLRDMNFTVY